MSLDISVLPENVRQKVISLLKIRDLNACRCVNSDWNRVIEEFEQINNYWHRQCREDFGEVFMRSRNHQRRGLTWHELHRALGLWAIVGEAMEEVKEYPFATGYFNKILYFQLLKDGMISIRSTSRITYFNILTGQTGSINKGEYRMHAESENHVITLNNRNRLTITRAIHGMVKIKNLDNVKIFTIIGPLLFLVTVRNHVRYIRLQEDKMQLNYVYSNTQPIICMGYNGTVLILTYKKKIYGLINKRFKLVRTINQNDDILNILLDYNLNIRMDWFTYKRWLRIFNKNEPASGRLRDITMVRKYGEMILIGTKWSDVLIYHVPKNQNRECLYNQTPVKIFNLSENEEAPKYSFACPITQIDVMEGKCKHLVIAATPYKVVTITLYHDEMEEIIKEIELKLKITD